jgi:hypothetical protein
MEATSLLSNQEIARGSEALVHLTPAKKNSCGNGVRRFEGWTLEDSTSRGWGKHSGENGFGVRLPRQPGWKSVKNTSRVWTATDSLKEFGKGPGQASPEGGYACYAGI